MASRPLLASLSTAVPMGGFRYTEFGVHVFLFTVQVGGFVLRPRVLEFRCAKPVLKRHAGVGGSGCRLSPGACEVSEQLKPCP